MIEEIKAIGTNFTKYYDLIIALLLRDIKVKYKRSISRVRVEYIKSIIDDGSDEYSIFNNISKVDIKNFPMYLITRTS
jgi:hypothetical protein